MDLVSSKREIICSEFIQVSSPSNELGAGPAYWWSNNLF